MSTQLTHRVTEILSGVCKAEHIKFPAQVNGDSRLSDLGINSLLFIKFVVKLEVEFEVDFDDESMDMNAFVTIADISAYIEQRVAIEQS